jgi:hypothetical protein
VKDGFYRRSSFSVGKKGEVPALLFLWWDLSPQIKIKKGRYRFGAWLERGKVEGSL